MKRAHAVVSVKAQFKSDSVVLSFWRTKARNSYCLIRMLLPKIFIPNLCIMKNSKFPMLPSPKTILKPCMSRMSMKMVRKIALKSNWILESNLTRILKILSPFSIERKYHRALTMAFKLRMLRFLRVSGVICKKVASTSVKSSSCFKFVIISRTSARSLCSTWAMRIFSCLIYSRLENTYGSFMRHKNRSRFTIWMSPEFVNVSVIWSICAS